MIIATRLLILVTLYSFFSSTSAQELNPAMDRGLELDSELLDAPPVNIGLDPTVINPGGPTLPITLDSEDPSIGFDGDPETTLLRSPPLGTPKEEPQQTPADQFPEAYPSKNGSIPSSTLQEAQQLQNDEKAQKFLEYIDSDDSVNCDAAINHYLSYFYGIDSLEEYFKKCSVNLWPDRVFTSLEIQSIESRTGVFVNEKGRVFCSGFIFEGEKAITARHCIKAIRSDIRNHFRLLSAPTAKISITGIQDGSCNKVHASIHDKSQQACDYAYVNLDTQSRTTFPSAAPPERFEPLSLVGYHPYMHATSTGIKPSDYKINNAPSFDIDLWPKGFIVNSGGTCSSYELKSISTNDTSTQCYMHSCQSFNGMSGTPLFVHRSGQLYFVGINIGANIPTGSNSAWQSSGTCGFAPDTSNQEMKNLAIYFKP